VTRELQAELAELKATWEALGASDPLWASLTRPETRGGRWDAAAFLATGEERVAAIELKLAALDLVPQRRAALDFGCGPGRLTAALARRYTHAFGFDLAGSMVRAARRLVGPCAVFTAQTWDSPTLACYVSGTFDFVLSLLTLQHTGPALAAAYIQELARVTAPGGILVLQVPDARASEPPAELQAADPGEAPAMRMVEVPEAVVDGALAAGGAAVVAFESSPWSCPGWQDRWYYARKGNGADGRPGGRDERATG
jgi:SAM-dependent methyltransferase